MTRKYEIILKYVKDMSVEIPNAEVFVISKEFITKYSLGINITTNSLKNEMIEINTKLTYKEIPLFGNGTESPLKIYYQKDGQRELLEFQVLPLLSEPAFSQIPFVCKTKCTITPGMLHASCGEVMGNHVIAESKLNQIEDVFGNLYPLSQVSGKGSLISFLLRFFRRSPDHFRDPVSFSRRSSNSHMPYRLRGTITDKF